MTGLQLSLIPRGAFVQLKLKKKEFSKPCSKGEKMNIILYVEKAIRLSDAKYRFNYFYNCLFKKL